MAADRGRVPLHVVAGGTDVEPTDADLARALLADEGWAIAATWNRFAPVVYGIASRALGLDSEAEDVTQEVFYRLFSRVGTLKNPEAFRSFVVSFAVRIVKWHLRRRRAHRFVGLSDSGQLPDVEGLSADPESREVLRRFYGFLDQLGAQDRLVFSLRHVESMTLEEIATALRTSVSTVKRAMERATTRIAGWIEASPDLAGYFERRRGSHEHS